jgi:hypothetical protein
MKVSKTKVPLGDLGDALYINIIDFKDEREWEIMFKKIEQLIKDSKVRTKVF